AWTNRNFVMKSYHIVKNKTLEIGGNVSNIKLASPTPVSTADWQTFSNVAYRYSVKYPKNWVYFQWRATAVDSTNDAYRETVGFDQGPKGNARIGGDIKISTYTQSFEATVADIKSQTSITNGPNKLEEEININLSGINYRKLTYTRFIPEPENYRPDDHQIYYIANNGNFSYVISMHPYRKYQAIDEEILESFQFK
ncbi:MAG: hypothetical protein HW405_966, partial [Candidatus Berkelbacteria bacterium]|nr:hypothetical protein [Candidatus Berkelbacteria bacterium]